MGSWLLIDLPMDPQDPSISEAFLRPSATQVRRLFDDREGAAPYPQCSRRAQCPLRLIHWFLRDQMRRSPPASDVPKIPEAARPFGRPKGLPYIMAILHPPG